MAVGGRTSLTTAIVVGVLFLLAIFFSPVAAMVPACTRRRPYLRGGADVLQLTRVKWEDLTEAVPAFMTAVMMPFSFSITEGDSRGLHLPLRDEGGHWPLARSTPCVLVVALLFVLKVRLGRQPLTRLSHTKCPSSTGILWLTKGRSSTDAAGLADPLQACWISWVFSLAISIISGGNPLGGQLVRVMLAHLPCDRRA